MSVKKCALCAGKKEFFGLGGMLKKCIECHGIGFVTDADADDKDKDIKVTDIKVKRSYNKKIKDDVSIIDALIKEGNFDD